MIAWSISVSHFYLSGSTFWSSPGLWCQSNFSIAVYTLNKQHWTGESGEHYFWVLWGVKFSLKFTIMKWPYLHSFLSFTHYFSHSPTHPGKSGPGLTVFLTPHLSSSRQYYCCYQRIRALWCNYFHQKWDNDDNEVFSAGVIRRIANQINIFWVKMNMCDL